MTETTIHETGYDRITLENAGLLMKMHIYRWHNTRHEYVHESETLFTINELSETIENMATAAKWTPRYAVEDVI